MTAPSPTLTLSEWLLRAIEADEAAARASGEAHWHVEWRWPNEHDIYLGRPAGSALSPADAAHIARHDPARVLAECAALRRVVEEHESVQEGSVSLPSCSTCGTAGEYDYAWPCDTLLALASIWSGEPGYDPSWEVGA